MNDRNIPQNRHNLKVCSGSRLWLHC